VPLPSGSEVRII